MSRKCSVEGCGLSNDKNGLVEIRLFRVPNDPDLRLKWQKAVGNPNLRPNNKICSRHFNEDDYTLKDRLLKTPLAKRRLKAGAVPSLSIQKMQSNLEHELGETTSQVRELERKAIDDAIGEYVSDRALELLMEMKKSEEEETKSPVAAPKRIRSGPRGWRIQQAIDKLKAENIQLEYQYHRHTQLLIRNKNLMEGLGKIFTRAQVSKLKFPDMPVEWDETDITAGIMLLKSLGVTNYTKLMRTDADKLLPTISTLVHYIRTNKIEHLPADDEELEGQSHKAFYKALNVWELAHPDASRRVQTNFFWDLVDYMKIKVLENEKIVKKEQTGPRRKPMVCCEITFHDRVLFNQHRKSHKPRTYPCPICGKEFTLKARVTRHLPVHSNEKPYVCEVCGLAFAQVYYLKDHTRNLHTEKRYTCVIAECGARFGHPSNLKRHLRRIHKVRMEKVKRDQQYVDEDEEYKKYMEDENMDDDNQVYIEDENVEDEYDDEEDQDVYEAASSLNVATSPDPNSLNQSADIAHGYVNNVVYTIVTL